ncbi:hypothetical protein AB0B60_04575 [Streptomyces lincolnensis]|uniref:hypothetical protein n=1 Tax=Streptomyces lincolnensis TaxID=1915 RepID=UPI001260165C|nr:hypothetical protein [Streptomyces lincolnensis]QMV10814.1 hypothetical protein GJU35_37485 [Streptomyces lincolnensis]
MSRTELPVIWRHFLRARRQAVIALGVAIITFAGVNSAYADDYSVALRNSSGSNLAILNFIDDGDDFHVWDMRADGHGVRAYVERFYAERWHFFATKYNGGGANSYTVINDVDVLSAFAHRMRICTVDGSGDENPNQCSNWKSFTEVG